MELTQAVAVISTKIATFGILTNLDICYLDILRETACWKKTVLEQLSSVVCLCMFFCNKLAVLVVILNNKNDKLNVNATMNYIFSHIFTFVFSAEFVANNFTVDVTVPTQPSSVMLTSVFGWIVIQQRVDNALDWNLPWATYKAGFGSINNNFWLGLEKMHLLTTSQSYRLRFEILVDSSWLWYSAEYWSFTVSDEADKYRLDAKGYSGDAGDGLHVTTGGYYYHDGMRFSTYDNDNNNCAAVLRGGWWFNNCHWVCLTCQTNSLHLWSMVVVDDTRLATSRMMIKPQQ